MNKKDDKDLELSNKFWKDEPNKFYEHYRTSFNPISFFAKLFLKQRNAWALSRVVLNKNDVIADIGCGSGTLLDQLANNTKHVYAIDISEQMIEEAKNNNNSINIEYVQSSCEPCPLNNSSIDTIISLGVLDYVRDIESFVIELNRTLRPGGVAIITAPKTRTIFSFLRWFNNLRKILTKMPPLVNIVSRVEMQKILYKANFEVIEMKSLWTAMWVMVIRRPEE